MNKIVAIGAIAALPLLAGCFDLEQGMVVEPNGMATLSVEMSIDSEMMALIASLGEGDVDPCDDLESDFVPASFTISSEEFERDGDTVCRTVATGPLEDLAAETPDVIEDGDGIILVSEGGGVYRFETALTSTNEGLGDLDDPDIVELFEGRTITFFLTAPRIIETNGEVDGDTVTLVVPAVELMAVEGDVFSMFVRFAL